MRQFKTELVSEVRQLLKEVLHPEPHRPWLRSKEVRQLMNISAGTLQNLRVSGKIQATKIGHLHYYKKEDIDQLLNQQS